MLKLLITNFGLCTSRLSCELEIVSWKLKVGSCDLRSWCWSCLMWSWRLEYKVGVGLGVEVIKFKLWRLFKKFEVRLQLLKDCECENFGDFWLWVIIKSSYQTFNLQFKMKFDDLDCKNPKKTNKKHQISKTQKRPAPALCRSVHIAETFTFTFKNFFYLILILIFFNWLARPWFITKSNHCKV